MTTPAPAAPRIFVSYSSQDRPSAQRLVTDLKAAGAEVWWDVSGIDEGDFIAKINDALRHCQWFVLVLTPNAIASQWVNDEMNAALNRRKQGFILGVLPLLAAQCLPGSIPPLWDALHRYDATSDYPAALASLLRIMQAPGHPTSTSALAPPTTVGAFGERPSLPGDPAPTPARLASLGFAARHINGVEVILPPLCDVPAGDFLMGSDPQQDKVARAEEQPQYLIPLPYPYQIGRHPVTVAEYACFVRAGHAAPASPWNKLTWDEQLKRFDHPVVNVSWDDATAYAAWLAKTARQSWRLPTEAEWEKAARWDPAARKSRIYAWGDSFDKNHCNTHESGIGATTPVGSYPTGASPCGAQDMTGNVWEWTHSLWKPYPYNPTDGRERADSTEDRVLRGGSWGNAPAGSRAAYRDVFVPTLASGNLGFRVVVARAAPGS
ncbi:MAG TPA: SUMF1/EgtB/PvdO family nonheme iron enzyme [Ktedonobacterales bacterium]